MQSYNYDKQLLLSCKRILRWGGLGVGACACIVTKCRYIVLTAEKLAEDAAELDNDEDDDDDDEDDDDEGDAAHVAGSSFAPSEDFEHLRDIDEDEDDIDEDDEEVRLMLLRRDGVCDK